MKRVGHLHESIAHPDNLRLAFTKAIRGKQQRADVRLFRADFEINIAQLSRDLLSGCPDIGHYHFFYVRDPKKRLICAASFPERVLHHAVMNICEPVFERYAIHDSYACRKDKGLRRAVHRCQSFAKKETWFLKMDIYKYFDSMGHAIALKLLSRHIKDKAVLKLFKDLLGTYKVKAGKGVPIGNLISQHLANFYLGLFDHWLKENKKVQGYLRYMDDMVIYAESKQELKLLFADAQVFLRQNLALTVKDDWVLNRVTTGIPFLGFHIFPQQIRLGRRSKARFKENYRRIASLYAKNLWDEGQCSVHLTPLVEFIKTADSFAFRKNILKETGVFS